MQTERDCMSDRIRRSLEDRIFSGALQPGQRLLEKRIAEEFDTSQTPVREALRELETMRLVESAPYRGTRVRAVSDRETAEAYAVRAVLEQLAARLAAPRFKGDAAQLREILARIHAAAREGDLQGYTAANLALHRKIVASSGNGVLLQAWDSLSFEARMRVVVSRRPHEMVELAATHDPIVDALEAGDGELAGRLLLEHSQGFIAIALSTGADVDPEANDETDEEPG